jgi:predicted acylesterase/phospholipase RssA
VPLAGGISPDEMVKVLEGTSARFEQLTPFHFYQPNLREFAQRPAKLAYDLLTYLPGVAWDLMRKLPKLRHLLGPSVRAFLAQPGYTTAEEVALALLEHVSPDREIPSLTHHVPSGFFDNAGLERWLRLNLERVRLPNDFREFARRRGNRLYVAACELDTSRRVIFGSDERHDVSISKAVQASTALPIFYKPARVAGVDYVDGGIRNTANLDLAIEKGADLIVCYNPFRPFVNRVGAEGHSRYFASGRYLSDRGLITVLNQVFRTLLHSRLQVAVQRYLADDRFRGDIVLLEPREHDAEFFGINPLAFWKRADSIRHGFESVRATIEDNFTALAEVFGRYGLRMDRRSAERKAGRLRAARGWRVSEPEERPEEGEPRLRVVGRAQ